MPGLLRGIARTAVIAGTATSVSNRVSRRQAGRWAEQEQQQAYQQQPPQQGYQQQGYQQQQYQQPAPPPQPSTGADERIAQLRQLGDLRASGVLTDAEFEEHKRRILNS
jgi:uncharacterized Zn finger protein